MLLATNSDESRAAVIDLLDYPSCFTVPSRLTHSTWVQHVPFGMFLIEALKPRVLVELGTYKGVSYCAFCQTIEALGLATSCYAVDTWAGDHQSGYFGDEVLNELRAHHDVRYSSFSHLVRSDFESACSHFSDHSIDLLHIDGLHTYDAVRQDFETWLPKMSNRGVVLFHDTNVREGDFGVWRFWEELQAVYPHFEMLHGYGLGVLAVGPEQPAVMQWLTALSGEKTAAVREFFGRLGSGLEMVREVAELRAQTESQAARLRAVQSSTQSSVLSRARRVWASEGMSGLFRQVSGRARS